MGHVNHAVYFTYLEQCRLTFWRELTGGPGPHTRVIIARAECDYRAPAHFSDELEIRLNPGLTAILREIVGSRSKRRSSCPAAPTSGSQNLPRHQVVLKSDSSPT